MNKASIKVKTTILFLFTCSILLGNNPSYAENKDLYTIESSEITVKELKNILSLDIFKYRIKVPHSSEIEIVLRDLVNNRDIFRFSPEILKHDEHTMLITFMRENDKIGSALMSTDETINYAINWNFQSVYSGSMFNFLKNYQSKYFNAKMFKNALEAKGKTVLIDFFAYKNEKEILLGQLFLNVK